MVRKFKTYLSAIIICIICTALFIGIGYLYLSASISQAETKQESIPFASDTPENAGIMFEILQSSTLIFFDFENGSVTYLNADNKQVQDGLCCGYSVDYTVSADYGLLSGVIDRIGGIELYVDSNLPHSYTGIQVTELLETSTDTTVLRKKIISAIFEKIALSGFSRSDFAYIIENSSCDLTVPDCYYWGDYMKEICAKTYFVN